ncbi:hypothetical protein LQ236_002240 [Nitrospina gracilis]|nr:hypothetical protein [Nitrospina sp. Nb-3]
MLGGCGKTGFITGSIHTDVGGIDEPVCRIRRHGGVTGIGPSLIIPINPAGNEKVPQGGLGIRVIRPFLVLSELRNRYSGQDRYDGNGDQNLDQGKAVLAENLFSARTHEAPEIIILISRVRPSQPDANNFCIKIRG